MMRECLDEGILQSYCDGELSVTQTESVTTHLTHCSSCSAVADELMSAKDIVFAALAPEFQTAVPTERLRQRLDEAIGSLRSVNPARVSIAPRAGGWFASLTGLFELRPQAFGYASLVAVLAFATVFGLAYWRSNPAPPVPDNQVASAVSKDVVTPPTQPTAADPGGTELPKPPSVIDVTPAQPRPSKSSAAAARKTVAKVKLLPGERSYLKTIAALDSTIKSANDRPMRPELRAEYERNLALVDRALAAARSAAKSNPDDPDAAEFVFTAYQTKVDLLNTVADARVYNRQP